MNNNLFIGLLSGSSMDAIDAAIVSFDNNIPELICTESYPIPVSFKSQCLHLSQQGQGSIDDFGRLDAEAGELFSSAVLSLLKKANVQSKEIRAIGSHGQNLRHRPYDNPPFSLQIGDPNIISERTGIITIADFRRRDLAAGGQGAPLAPGFHSVVFGHQNENRVIVNIGGISNITLLPKDPNQHIIGFDTGPGNCLMDSWVSKYWQLNFDAEGKIASQGNVQSDLLNYCLEDEYFKKTPPKSTGREYFNLQWLDQKINELNFHKNKIEASDIQATLLALTADSIASMIQQHAPVDAEIFVCGGGAHNDALMKKLNSNLQKEVLSTEKLGISPDWVEAMLFAWLAKQTLAGKSGNCPSVTGAKRAIPLGGIFGFSNIESNPIV